MKKNVLLVMIGAFGFSLLSFAYDFSAADVNGNTIYYNRLGGDSVEVTYQNSSYASYSGEILLPETVSDGANVYRVTTIGTNAFTSSTVTKLEIPTSLCDLASSAFTGGTNNILELTFQHLKKINSSAFNGLIHIQKIHIKSVEDKVMGVSAFTGCCDLEDVLLPMDIEDINSEAFKSCLLLKELQLPEAIMSIPAKAFRACWNLRHITIPENVTTIGDEAFLGCIWLKSITIPKNVQTIGNDFICGRAMGPYEYSYVAHYGGYTIDGGLYPGAVSSNQLNSIYFEGLVPPTVTSSSFSQIIKDNVTCYVPNDALDVYKANSLYTNAFAAIVGINMGESEVTDIAETTANILWEPDPLVEQYEIDVYELDNHFAHFLVDANENILSQQYYAPTKRKMYNSKPHLMPQDTTISGTDYYIIRLSGLSASTQYTYTIQGFRSVPDMSPEAAPGAMIREKVYYEEGNFQTLTPTALPEIEAAMNINAKRKVFLINGQIVIVHNGKVYDVMGRRIVTHP